MNNSYFNFANKKIVVVGDVILDVYFMGQVRRLSPEAPVPIVQVKKKNSSLGGAGNVALNLAGLGCHTTLLGIRGDDAAGEQVSSILKQNEIRGNLIVDQSHPTTSKTRIIGQGQQLLRLDEEEIWQGSEICRSRLLAQFKECLVGVNAVILSDYNKGVLNGDISREIISWCKAKHIPVFVDPKRKNWERFQEATCITPNTPEIEEITGSTIEGDETVLVELAHSLRERYHFDWLLATRGPEGMCLVGPEGPPFFIKATAHEVYDVSGAGDTVIATMTAGVASGLPFPKAAELANLAAGIVVGKLGAQPISLAELRTAWRMNESRVRRIDTSKITTLEAAQLQVKAWQAFGEKVVFAHGCFELLHPGHIHILNQAKELGDRLVVGLNSDVSTGRRKGPGRPILSEEDRARILSALRSVDMIVIIREDRPLSLIKALKPDILVKGPDVDLEEMIDQEIAESYSGKVHQVSLLEGYSTTQIVRNLLTKS